jgi:O-antigen ligase
MIIHIPNFSLQNQLKYMLFLYPAFIFLPYAFSNIVLAISILLFLWGWIVKKVDLSNFKKHYKWYLIIIIPWVLTLISTIHSNNMSRGFDFVIQRHPILIYPFLYFTINPDQKSKQLGIKTIIFFTLYGVIHSWVNFLYSYPNTFYHFNHNEVQQSTIIQHPYLGMMSLVSLVLLFNLENLKNISKLLLVCIAFLFISGIVLSTSRLAILLLGLIGVYFIFQKLKSKYRWILGGTFVLGILFFVMQTSLLQKFSNELTFEKSPRLLLWNNALQLTKNNESIVGIGIGDYYTKKIDPFWFLGEYQKYKYNFRGLYGYECHNLYVENILLTGILGLFFIAGIGIIFIYLLKQKNELNLILFLLLTSFMFTETLLLRQWGIIFYVFVMSLILHSNKPKTQSL